MRRGKRDRFLPVFPPSLFNGWKPGGSAARDFVQDRAVRRDKLNVQRHLPYRVRGATQARVVAADAVLDAVEHGLGYLIAAHVIARDLGDGLVHRQVVLAGGDDEVDLTKQAVPVNGIVVEERAPRGFTDAHAAETVD